MNRTCPQMQSKQNLKRIRVELLIRQVSGDGTMKANLFLIFYWQIKVQVINMIYINNICKILFSRINSKKF